MNGTMTEGRVKESSLRDIYYVLFRHKKRVIIFFFVVIITVTLGTFMSPEIYQSEAKLMLKLGRESVTLDPTASTSQVVSVSQSFKPLGSVGCLVLCPIYLWLFQ